jgi:hypothetical protein
MISRKGSQALTEGTPFWFSEEESLHPTPKSVITGMAGFALLPRLHLPGRHISTPPAFRYALMVSRRTRAWIFRRDHPSLPKAKICCFLSSFKTFAILREATYPLAPVNVLDAS